jgi:hypothetical protein
MTNAFCVVRQIPTQIGSILVGVVRRWTVSYDSKVIYRVNSPLHTYRVERENGRSVSDQVEQDKQLDPVQLGHGFES